MEVVAFFAMIYSAWRALVNGMLMSEVQKKFGSLPPSDLPNYEWRMWGWIAATVLAGVKSNIFFSGGACMGRWC